MTTRRLFILTGASRGMGAAIARQLLAADTHLLTLSRHPEPALGDAARAAGAVLEQWALDLTTTSAPPPASRPGCTSTAPPSSRRPR